jgi:hypothetical protein
LAEAWPTYGYLDPIPTAIDPLYYLTKFVATGTNISYPFNSDTSTNNFNLTINGDAKAANFHPYASNYYGVTFDGSTGWMETSAVNAAFNLLTNPGA